MIKTHYEATPEELRGRRGVLADAEAEIVFRRVLAELPTLGVRVLGHIPSPIRGGMGKGKAGKVEYLAVLIGRNHGRRW